MKIAIALVCVTALWATTALADPGAWQIEDKTSALDGAQSYAAIIQSDDSVTNILGQPEKATVGFSCNREGFAANIHWPDFVQKEDIDDLNVTVVWKLDDGKPMQNAWIATTNAVAQLGRNGLLTLKTWSVGHKLVVRVPDQHGGQEVTFSLDGIADVYTTVSQRNCG